MNKEEIWNQLCDRHPEFKDPEYVVKQRARGLKALIDQAYDNGVENGKRVADAINKLKEMGQSKTDPSIFDQVFGKRP